MFGSIGFPELIMIFIVVLLVFGPKKLPEFAKLLGKTVREFRSTIDDAKAVIENEIYKEGLSNPLQGLDKDIKEGFSNPLQDLGKDIQQALNVYGNSDTPAKDSGRGIPDAVTPDSTAGHAVDAGSKGKDDEKSE